MSRRKSARSHRRGLFAIVPALLVALVAGCTSVAGTPTAGEAGPPRATAAPGELGIDASSPDVADPDVAGPSSRTLIADALAAGDIDEPTSWLYRTWLTFDEGLVPEQFLGEPDAHDTELLTSLPPQLSELPDGIRAAIEPYFLRPTDPRSAFSASDDDPPGFRGAHSSAIEGAPYRGDQSAGGDGRCSDGWATIEVVGVPFRVWACMDLEKDADGATPTALATVANVVSKYAGRMIADMGEPIPDDPASDPEPRSDDRIDIYVVPTGAVAPKRSGVGHKATPWATTISVPPYTSTTASSYIVVSTAMLTDGALLERAMVHELFHLFQYTHNARLASRWFYDASAEWAAAHYVRHDSRRLHDIRLPVLQNTVQAFLQDPFDLSPYGAYLWPLFMEQQVGAASVFAAWKTLAGVGRGGTDDDVIRALDKHLAVSGNFPEFVMRMFNADLPGNPIATRFVRLDGAFPDGRTPSRAPKTVGEEPLAIDYERLYGTGFEFTPVDVEPPKDAAADSVVYVTVMGDLATTTGKLVTVEALVRKRSGNVERTPIRYTGNGTRVCVAGELTLVLSNPSTDMLDLAAGTLLLERDEQPGCATVEVTHPQTGKRMPDSGAKVGVAGEEEDGKPDTMPLVVTVLDAPADEISRYDVTVELSGGTLRSSRELSWPLSEFEMVDEATYRLATTVDLDFDLTDANRPMSIDARLLDEDEEVDSHAPRSELHGSLRDACLIGSWIIPEAELQRFYDAVGDPKAKMYVNGNAAIAFTDTEYEYIPLFDFAMDFGGIGATAVMAGGITGSYDADGTVVTTRNDVSTISVSVNVLGKTVDATGTMQDFIRMSPINRAPYECTDSGPVLMFGAGGGDRVPVRLAPAG